MLGREEAADQYRKGFAGLEIAGFDSKAANEFARLRAVKPGLRSPDAIQLACALGSQCDVFLTNDDRLSKNQNLTGLKALPLSRWKEAI